MKFIDLLELGGAWALPFFGKDESESVPTPSELETLTTVSTMHAESMMGESSFVCRKTYAPADPGLRSGREWATPKEAKLQAGRVGDCAKYKGFAPAMQKIGDLNMFVKRVDPETLGST